MSRTYKVVQTKTGESAVMHTPTLAIISEHASKTKAEAARHRYETADAIRDDHERSFADSLIRKRSPMCR